MEEERRKWERGKVALPPEWATSNQGGGII